MFRLLGTHGFICGSIPSFGAPPKTHFGRGVLVMPQQQQSTQRQMALLATCLATTVACAAAAACHLTLYARLLLQLRQTNTSLCFCCYFCCCCFCCQLHLKLWLQPTQPFWGMDTSNIAMVAPDAMAALTCFDLSILCAYVAPSTHPQRMASDAQDMSYACVMPLHPLFMGIIQINIKCAPIMCSAHRLCTASC